MKQFVIEGTRSDSGTLYTHVNRNIKFCIALK